MKIKWHIETKAIAELVPHPKNPRQFTKKGIADLSKSIDAFGLAEPIVVNTDNTICGGHARVMVLKQRGETECECYVPDRQLSEKEVEQLMIRLNANQAGVWDTERLVNEWDLSELMDWGLDLPEFRNLEAQEDDYIIPDEIVTDIKRGDLFEIGEHRLLAGDSTKAEDVEKLMNGEKADMIFTDPPYNINLGNRGNAYNKYKDNKSNREFEIFLKDSFSNMTIFSKTDCPFYIFSANRDLLLIKKILEELGLRFHQWLMWVKRAGIWGNTDYIQNYEIITYAYKGRHQYFGSKGQEAAIIENREQNINTIGHPTSKPIKVLEPILKGGSRKDNIILDLFGGSGSTLIACEQLNRKCFMMEIDERYCAVIIDRMKKAFPDIEIQQIN